MEPEFTPLILIKVGQVSGCQDVGLASLTSGKFQVLAYLDLDLASQEKERLEEKQREARKERAKEDAEWRTR